MPGIVMSFYAGYSYHWYVKALIQYILTGVFVIVMYVSGYSQCFNRIYSGYWSNTTWDFYFNKDGSFTRISTGYYGHTKAEGKYRVSKDTLYILSCTGNMHGTINDKYYLKNDSAMFEMNSYSIFKRLPMPKGKKGATCYIEAPGDSIYIKHPYILPRLDANIHLPHGVIEEYVLGDTISATIVDYRPGKAYEHVQFSFYGHRDDPNVFIVTDQAGDYFMILSYIDRFDYQVGEQITIYPQGSSEYYNYEKYGFDEKIRPVFMVFGWVKD
jgi:hypothetical protein